MNASKTLSTILSIIDKDVRRIKKVARGKAKLSEEDALLLMKYASTLDVVSRGNEKAKEAEKQKFAKMSTDELIKLHQQKNQKDGK